MNKNLILILLLAFFVLTSSYFFLREENRIENVSRADNLYMKIVAEPYSSPVGENSTIQVTVKNVGNENLTYYHFDIPWSIHVHVFINETWYWLVPGSSSGREFRLEDPIRRRETLSPRESTTFTTTWDGTYQESGETYDVPPGEYVIKAIFPWGSEEAMIESSVTVIRS